jgi:hypothetical protein
LGFITIFAGNTVSNLKNKARVTIKFHSKGWVPVGQAFNSFMAIQEDCGSPYPIVDGRHGSYLTDCYKEKKGTRYNVPIWTYKTDKYSYGQKLDLSDSNTSDVENYYAKYNDRKMKILNVDSVWVDSNQFQWSEEVRDFEIFFNNAIFTIEQNIQIGEDSKLKIGDKYIVVGLDILKGQFEILKVSVNGKKCIKKNKSLKVSFDNFYSSHTLAATTPHVKGWCR